MLAMIGDSRRGRIWVGLVLGTMICAGGAYGQDAERHEPALNVKWQKGPCTGQIGGQAQIKVPSDYQFLPQGDAGTFIEACGNISTGRELGVLRPKSKGWFLLFEFEDVGYVKDDEKSELDADALFKQMKESEKPANEERKKRGLKPMYLLGWAKKPAYNEQTHNLEFALRVKDEHAEFINQKTKILGRNGVMVVTWVGDTQDMDAAMVKCTTLLGGFQYTSGNKYAEFKAGDKIAKYGLTALVTGGTAAVLLKTGLLQKFGKLIIVGAAAVVAAISRFFKKIFGRRAQA